MLAVSASELASLQTEAAQMLDLACTIQRKTRTVDGTGSSSETYTTIATCNVGMAQPSAGQLANYAALIGSLATWLVRLPNATDVKAQDRLIVSGQTLEVNVVL